MLLYLWSEVLSERAVRAIGEAEDLHVSVFPFLEAGLLIRTWKIRVKPVPLQWLKKITRDQFFRILPLSAKIAFHNVLLQEFHPDPADRDVVATCMAYHAKLVTKDRLIQ